ncbi:TonB-dependent siderophore receptor [Eikenella sp. S3360]|uniref:TonB-dependent siderophore receptor n=1 Tax=Eikenella glucosivorans TaxID=2766967 RepID=A0ABS0N938_9NEIS|nr:TonB-dependent siderophore receptor [Eikenella glucosivorans]MBH5328786.1 TonB-dependent siderophore receptor [Eikenella glucosivorans]
MQQPFKLSLIAALLAAAAPAWADQSTEPANTAELETIQVTSRNRSTRTENRNSYTTSAMRTTTGLALSPKETPQSVSVITKTQLDDQNISRIEDALKTTTGVNVFRDSNRFRFQSRGFYINRIEEDGMAVTVSGSMLNTNADPHSQTDLAIYDHIEVVRGATGLTQGNGEPGGTINVVRKRPTSMRQASASISADRFGSVRGVGDFSGALNEARTVRGRAVVAAERSDSFKDVVDGRKYVLYGVLDADLGENTKATISATYQNEHSVPDRYGVPMALGGRDAGFSRKTFLGADWNTEETSKLNLFGEVEYRFNEDWKLTGKVNYTKSRYMTEWAALGNTATTYTGLPADGTLAVSGRDTRMDNNGSQFGLQANLVGKYRLLNREHDVFVTLNHTREKLHAHWRQHTSTANFNAYDFHHNIVYPDFNTGPYRFHEYEDYTLTTQGIAAGTRFNILDNLHLIAGTRYTRWKSDYHDRYAGTSGVWTYEPNYKTKNRFVPYFGLTWDITPNHSLYASYTQIFNPHLSARDAVGKPLSPMTGTNIEVGWKADWFGDNSLNTALALFHIIQKNRSIGSADRSPYTGRYYNIPLGRIQSHGFDAEISGSLNENWKIFAGYTFNTSKYRTTEGSQAYFQEGANYNSWTPKHMFRLYTSYRLPFGERRWTIGGGVSAQSKTGNLYTGTLQSSTQGGYALWNANVQYEFNDHIKLSLIGTNLTDKRYYENNRVRTRGINNFFGEPRNIMLKLDWKL